MGSCGNCSELTRRSVSSRRGKKSSTSDKPRQPQRGMGVAQLEKIRLHGELQQAAGRGNNFPSAQGPMLTSFTKAQEDIRSETQFSQQELYSAYVPASTSMSGYPPSFMMGFIDTDRRDMGYSSDLRSYTMGRFVSSNSNISRETYCSQPPSVTLSLLQQPSAEWLETKRWHSRCDSIGSSSRQSDSSDLQELDLDLKLSL